MACEISGMSCSLCPYCGQEECPHLNDKSDEEPLVIKVTLAPLREAIKGCFSLYHFQIVKEEFNKKYRNRREWLEDCKKGNTLSYLKKEIEFMYFLNPTEEEINEEINKIQYKELTSMYGWSHRSLCYLSH